MYDFLRLENLKGDFKNLLDAVRGGKATTAFSLVQGAKNHVTSAIPGVKLLIVPDRLAAETAYTRLKAYVNDRVVFIPDKDDVLLNRKAGSVGLMGRRIEALTRLIQNKAEIAVIPAEALLQYYPNVDAFRAAHVTLMKEEEYAPEKVANKLVSMGYTRVESMSDRLSLIHI